MPSITALAASTPATRDRFVDAVRAAAILAVVVGHWLIAVVIWDTTGVTASNALSEAPALQWATWAFQVMPLFFVVGGFANRAALLAGRRRGDDAAAYLSSRLTRLVAPVVPLALAWIVAGPLLRLAGVPGDTVERLTSVMGQPLWFLAVYLVVSALAPWTLRVHERLGLVGPVLVLALVTVVNDVAALPFVHSANYLTVFALAHQLGYGLGDGTLSRLRRRHLVAVTGAAVLILLVLTGPGPYPRSMVGVPGEATSNMSPPSAALLALTALQLGVVLLVRPAAVRRLRGGRLWTAVVAVNASIMTIFLWHLTALALGAAFLFGVVGFPQPTVGSFAWWFTRVPWVVTMIVVLVPIVVVAGRVEQRALRSPARSAPRLGAVLASLVVVAVALVALALVGFGGPVAVVATAALVVTRTGAGGIAPRRRRTEPLVPQSA